MIYNDGPVMMIQLENEYGFWYIHDVDYLKDVQAAWIENGITGPFFNADPPNVLSADVRLPGNAIGLNGEPINSDFDKARNLEENVPIFVTETYTGWYRHWGDLRNWSPTNLIDEVSRFS